MSNWRNIETAPKDGSHIIGVDLSDGEVSVYFWFPTWYGNKSLGEDLWMPANLDEEYGGTVRLTHWQPLPDPPQLDTETQSDNVTD